MLSLCYGYCFMIVYRSIVRIVVTIILLSIGGIVLRAQQIDGGLPGAFLSRPIGVRALGLGGVYTAMGNESGALWYNPSSLMALTDRPQLSFGSSVLGLGRTQNVISYGQTLEDGQIGIGGTINHMRLGTALGRDQQGTITGEFTNDMFAIQGGVAAKYGISSFGVSLKYINNTLSGLNLGGSGYGIDVGMRFDIEEVVTVGVSAQNILGSMSWNSVSETLPYVIRLGVATEFLLEENAVDPEPPASSLPFSGGVSIPRYYPDDYVSLGMEMSFMRGDAIPTLKVAAEFFFMDMVAVRGSVPIVSQDFLKPSFFNTNQFGAGIGFRQSLDQEPFAFQIDYAVSRDRVNTTGIAHHLSVSVQF